MAVVVKIRPSWDDYFLAIAVAVAARADCQRARYGAVIVKDHRIVATGYNGSPTGDERSCLAGECPRGGLAPGQPPPYNNCIALHAEQNAIAFAAYAETRGATLYLTGPPCDMCAKLARAAGIVRVVHPAEAPGRPLGSPYALCQLVEGLA